MGKVQQRWSERATHDGSGWETAEGSCYRGNGGGPDGFAYAGAFDLRRYVDALPAILQLAAGALPLDFSRWQKWGRPLLETLSMSIAGTVLGAATALPPGALISGAKPRNSQRQNP